MDGGIIEWCVQRCGIATGAHVLLVLHPDLGEPCRFPSVSADENVRFQGCSAGTLPASLPIASRDQFLMQGHEYKTM